MAKFKCMVSGNIVEFKNENDIKDMLTHPQYTLYVEPVVKKEVKPIVKG
jgi:hypothetical protein